VKKHKHAEIIKAWADGAEIEYQLLDGDKWWGSSNPWRGTEIGKTSSPAFEEWLMDWPVQWTELTAYETDKFQQWQQQHGGFLADETN